MYSQDEATVDTPWCVSTGFAVPVGSQPMDAAHLIHISVGFCVARSTVQGNAKASDAERASV